MERALMLTTNTLHRIFSSAFFVLGVGSAFMGLLGWISGLQAMVFMFGFFILGELSALRRVLDERDRCLLADREGRADTTGSRQARDSRRATDSRLATDSPQARGGTSTAVDGEQATQVQHGDQPMSYRPNDDNAED